MDDFAKAVRLLRPARRIAVLTGAGISTESGIPDFRSKGGLWTRFDPDEFHYDRFLADPARFWAMRAELMRELDLDARKPNDAHHALARLSRAGRLRGLVTQNIDGLHALAHKDAADGASTEDGGIVEIHGSARRVRCTACLAFFPFEVAAPQLAAGRVPPSCPSCRGILKPGTVLFGEMLPEDAVERAQTMARSCDAFVAVGSSLEVWPAAGLPLAAQDCGASLVIVNRDATALDDDADAVVRGRLGDVLPRLVDALLA